MPFMGLLDGDGREIKGKGYHRIDGGTVTFKMSPTNIPGVHWLFVNASSIVWTAKGTWPRACFCAVYDEVDDKQPLVTVPLDTETNDVRAGDTIMMMPDRRKNHRANRQSDQVRWRAAPSAASC